MFKVTNLLDNDDVRVTKELQGMKVIEYQRDLSLTPENAQIAYFAAQMNVRKRQLICDLSKNSVTIQPGAMQIMIGDVHATTGLKGAGDFLKKTFRSSVTKEATIKPEYKGSGLLILEPTFKHIVLQSMEDWPDGMVLDDGLFMACDANIEQKVVARSTFSSAMLGNEGLFNTLLYSKNGKGVVALECPVDQQELIIVDLVDDIIKIDGNMAIAWSKSLKFTVERSGKTLMGSAASGEGLVNTFSGTGRIIISPVENTNIQPTTVIE